MMADNKYLKAISKFSKETIIKSMCFSCLNPERVLRGCVDFEIDKKQKEISNLDKKIKKFEKQREHTLDEVSRITITLEISRAYDKTNKIYDEIFKLQEQY